MFLGYQNGKIKFYTQQPLDNVFYNLEKIEETELEYVLDGEEYVLNDEAYKEKQAQIEKERIAKLTCTKRVFALMLQELGITYTQLKELISTNEQAQLEWDLCVELQRANPLLDIMASQLGITPEQLDGLFRYANGEITIEDFRGLIVVEEDDPQENQSTSELEPTNDPRLTHGEEVTEVKDEIS